MVWSPVHPAINSMHTLFRRAAGRGHFARLLHTECAAGAVGFAGIQGLSNPNDWFSLAKDATVRCEELVQRAITRPPSAATVQTLDDISDVLCQVLDAAEFCRNVHISQDWRAAAQQVCIELGGYVQHLNTHYGLYTALGHALNEQEAAAAAAATASGGSSGGNNPAAGSNAPRGTSSSSDGWTEESVLVGRMLKRDFEKYGVHLSGRRRDRMTQLVKRAQQLGMEITQNIVTPSKMGTITLQGDTSGALNHLPPNMQRSFRPLADKRSGRVQGVSAPADSALLGTILKLCPDEEVRKEAFLVYSQRPSDNVRLLDELVEARHGIATLMGFESYSHYQLDGVTLANRPEAVWAFLQHLSSAIQPKCQEEVARLQQVKDRMGRQQRRAQGGAAAAVQPWDRAYLMSLAKGMEGSTGALSQLPHYFELERCMEGLSTMLKQLMGVTLEERPMQKGEEWAPGVRKLAAVHDSEGLLGTVYLDLYQRASKFPGAAHFTLRCGRRAADGSYQTPVVALVAGMSPGSDLAHSEVEMLFHEFGHAIHSLLSRTQFQHLAGTRGPLDTVEIPSHTMEHFAIEPQVLSTFARHRTSGQPLPRQFIDALWDSRRMFAGLDQQQQLVYCAVDQLLHGPNPPTGQRAQQLVGDIVEQYSSLGYCPGTYPHLRFNHIVGYGATYYSYLYAQCLSANIWQQHLAGHPLSRAAGEALRHKLLEPGGAKEAHSMVEDLLGGSMMHAADGGWYPDAHGMLVQQGLLV